MDLNNIWVQGFIQEQEETKKNEIEQIARECGQCLSAQQLTDELNQRGIIYDRLSISDKELLDLIFDVY